MVKFTKSLFFKPKDKSLARKISIVSPTKFKNSITRLRKGGITLKDKRALVLARTRASVQLKRKNLSPKERRQFRTISKMVIPRITRRKRTR